MSRAASTALAVLLAAGAAILMPPTRAGAQTQQVVLGTTEAPSAESVMIRRVLPSVVNVTIRRRTPGTGSALSGAGGGGYERVSGTGFVIDASGLIATNYHVVENALDIAVTLNDGLQVPARLLHATRLVDIAVLKIDVPNPLPVLKWGNSEALRVGDEVIAIGNALGLGISASGGLVSALNRNIMASPYDDYIQTDAAINHGNSGGPLMDMKGEVVGIDTALISPTSGSSGLGFAIPSESAKLVIERLMNYGWLRPGYIGVKIQQLTPDMQRALALPRPDASIVANVIKGGPADTAGLLVGDVILRVANSTPQDERAILRSIARTPAGQDITFVLWRDGHEASLTVTVREWPRSQWDAMDAPVAASAPREAIPPDLGLKLAALDDETRAKSGLGTGQPGILVAAVEPGSDASLRGLSPGDVILRVGNRPVSNQAEAQAAIDAARAEKRSLVMVLILPKVQDKPGPEWIALRCSDG